MPKKPERPSVEQLRNALKLSQSEMWRIYEDYTRHKPHINDLPALREALNLRDRLVVRLAADSIAKLGPEAKGDQKLEWALLSAGRQTDGLLPPQAYPQCLNALVSIGADATQIIDMVHCHFGVTNWCFTRPSLEALKHVGTPEALDLLGRIIVFKWPELHEKQRRFIRTHFSETVALLLANRTLPATAIAPVS